MRMTQKKNKTKGDYVGGDKLIVSGKQKQMHYDGTAVTDGAVYCLGKKFLIPGHIQSNRTAIINGRVYIGTYRLDPHKDSWKRSIKAVWHNYISY